MVQAGSLRSPDKEKFVVTRRDHQHSRRVRYPERLRVMPPGQPNCVLIPAFRENIVSAFQLVRISAFHWRQGDSNP
jgi:hypothetical protein